MSDFAEYRAKRQAELDEKRRREDEKQKPIAPAAQPRGPEPKRDWLWDQFFFGS